MTTCKGLIYHTMKSKIDPTPCKNKAKDQYGFCHVHKKQSKDYEYKLQHGYFYFEFKIQYEDYEPCSVRMRANQQMRLAIRDINEKYNVQGYLLTYNGDFIDLSLPAYIFDGCLLKLELKGG